VRFAFDEQIESQPHALRTVLDRPPFPPLDPSRPLIFCGFGSSFHAARIAARWAGFPAQAFESNDLPPVKNAQLVAISHSGHGVPRGATVAVIGEQADANALLVLRTCPPERAQTHSVSYTCALAVLARLLDVDTSRLISLVQDALAFPIDATPLRGRTRMLVAGHGLDAISAEETALKLKEACFVWAEGMSVDAAMHGPQFAFEESMAAVLFADGRDLDPLRKRIPSMVIPSPDCPPPLRPFFHAVIGQRLAAATPTLRSENSPGGQRSGLARRNGRRALRRTPARPSAHRGGETRFSRTAR
jgi:glucosamine--fructose-6-phosphate aminotransferase (isomerizing)